MSSYPFTNEHGESFSLALASGPSADAIPCAYFDAIAANPEQEAGDASEWMMWAGRVGRRVALVDEYGFRSVTTFENVADAAAFISRVEEQHATDMGEGAA
jgi:hypothetical protein